MYDKNCVDCGIPLVPCRKWRSYPISERVGFAEHAGAGRCRKHYKRLMRDTPKREGDRLQDLEWVAVEWEFLSSPWLSQRENAEHLAPRMGMHPDTLERHLRFLRVNGRLPMLERFRDEDGRMASRVAA